MEVRKGYKQTEVGVIPEDWEIKTLEKIGTFKKGKGIKKDSIVSDGLPCIRYGEIYTYHNDYIKQFNSYINRETANKSQAIKAGDLLFAGSGETAEEIGKCVAYLDNKEAYAGGDIIILSPAEDYDSNYLGFLMNHKIVSKQKSQMGQGDAVVHIYSSNLAKLSVPLPPTKAEQTAISTALSDADALINSLGKFLTKKRNIKQGAMQELLTGKKRLPGFEQKKGYRQTDIGVIPDDWDVKNLKEISFMKGRIGWQGLKETEFTMNPEEPFLITGMNFKDGRIRWNEVYHVSLKRYELAKNIQLKIGDVLITKDGTIGKLLFVDEIPYPNKATLNSHLLVFRPLHNSYVPKFIYYQLASKIFRDYIELSKSGSTFFGISQEAVGNYKTILPAVGEQTAIATVLSDMDTEIEALENKLSKYCMIKHGMMQELLTGKTRLI